MIRFSMTLMASAVLATAAMAGDITVLGDTTGGPTWQRTLDGNPPTTLSVVGTATPYEVFSFRVTADGTYDFLSTATTPGYDNFLHLYVGAFDPTDQFNGVLIANDDFGDIGISGFSFSLTAGPTYLTVNSGFDNRDFGTYTMGINGPGDIIPVREITINGDTTGGPTWQRTLGGNPPTTLSAAGTATPYEVFAFSVTADGTYDFLSTATTPGYDNFLHLYVGAFDPTDQFNGVLIANDDFGDIGISGFSFSLTAGLTYLTVNSGFDNRDFGTYTMRISGPGDIIPDVETPVIPEPATWVMMIAGFGLIGAAARRRRSVPAHA